jgi:hypothetical protein
MNRFEYRAILAGWLALMLQAPAALAQDAASDPQPQSGDAIDAIDAIDPTETDDTRFVDPQRLFETFAGDALNRLAAAQDAAIIAETDRDAAIAGGTAAPEEIAALEAQLQQALDSQMSAEAEIATIADLVVLLSEDQIFDLNRSLDDALASGVTLYLEAALLQRVIDGNYDHRQINALTQGLEREESFPAKRDPF